MKQFINGNDQAFAELEQRARHAYIVFHDQELPSACVPGRARIGFRVDPKKGRAGLLVDHGVQYFGTSETVRRWFETGEVSFPNFADLRQWIQNELKAEFERDIDDAPIRAPTLPNGDRSVSGRPCAAALYYHHPVPPDNVTFNRVTLFGIQQFGTRYGLDVQSVDLLVLESVSHSLITKKEQTADTIFDAFFSASFSLAALRNYSAITVHAGQPVLCKPVEKKHE